MINFNSSSLKNWLEENLDFLNGARIQKIQQPTRRDFVFVLRNKGETRKLYININPQCFHVSFMSQENEQKRLIEIPKKPPMFCMLLRKYLENAVISQAEQPQYERILEFYIETYNELSEKIYLCLAIELMGKYSNVILYNYENNDTRYINSDQTLRRGVKNIILGCAHNVGAEKSREREMAGGLPYVYPSSRPNCWYGNAFENNQQIDDYYAQCIYDEKFKKLKNSYIQIVNKKLSKAKNSLAKMKKQIVSNEKVNKYRLYGDLIMVNLYNNNDYSESINVFDYENNCDITIQLDKTFTLKENANRFYKLYNKNKIALEKYNEISTSLNEEVNYCAQLLYSLEIAQTVEELADIGNEIEPQTEKKHIAKSSIEPMELEIDGCKVFVGKNNRQNDFIVSKLSRDEDYWFHTKDCAGSHVLLRCENPSDDLIFKCAQLAKQYSKGSQSSKVGVIYTKRKYLKKPPKANLGYVIYKNEQEIIV